MSSSNRKAVRQGDMVVFHLQSRTVVRVLLIGLLFYVGVKLVAALAPFLLTLLIAAFLAVAADPVVRWLEGKGMARLPAVLLLLLAALLGLALAVFIFVPPLVDQGQKLVTAVPDAFQHVRDSSTYRDLDRQYDIVGKATKQLESLPGRFSGQVTNIVTAVLAGLFGVLTIIFLVVLLLLGGDTLVGGIAQLFPQVAERRAWRVVQGAYRSIGAFVAGTFIVALIAGITMFIALLALGIPYAAPLALWMMLFDMVPLIGASIGALPAIVVAFAAGGAVPGLIMLGFVIGYQQLENFVIQPGVQGRIVELPPLIIFMSVLVGAQLLGVVGALFAVPVAGITQIVIREWLESIGRDEVELPPIAPDEAPEPPEVGPQH